MAVNDWIMNISHLLIFLLFPVFLHAQHMYKEDVIELKNGNIIRGEIFEQVPGEYVKVELVGGSILILKPQEITKITSESSRFKHITRKLNFAQKSIQYREKGVYAMASFHFYSFIDQWQTLQLRPSLHFKIGHRFNRFVSLGAGTGLDFYQGGMVIPFYLDVSGDLKRKRVTPHYFVQGGYGAGVAPFWPNDQFSGGAMGHFGGGFKWHTRSKHEWLLTVGYQLQQTRETSFFDVWGPGGFEPGTTVIRRLNRGLTWRVALGF